MRKFWLTYDRCLRGMVLVTSFSFVALALAQIFCRYVLGSAIAWAEEVCRLFFYATVLFGSAVCITEYRHIVIDILTLAMSRSIKRYYYLFVYAVVFLFCAFLMVYGLNFALQNTRQRSPALLIPFVYIYMVTPAASLLMCINLIRVAIKDFTVTYAPQAEQKGGEAV
ncbi:MAG: TRAP transporter small permease [Treponema sp.]|jgi:TRAP-type C4-dicarboxylate transport system permease small subunit|nr:TRAP transporter small permease [Treponema sp.]